MKSFVPSLYKFILGMFLFGLAFLANPIEGFAQGAGYTYLQQGSFNVPTSTYGINSTTFNVNDDSPVNQYGFLTYSSFDIDFDSRILTQFSNLSNLIISGNVKVSYDLQYMDFNGVARLKPLGEFLFDFNLFNSHTVDSYNLTLHSFCEGTPTGLRVYVSPYVVSTSYFALYDQRQNDPTFSSYTVTLNLALESSCRFYNFSFDESSSGSSGGTIINNVNSNLTPIGYSSLNFGVNGNVYFLNGSYVFTPDYLAPLSFLYDFYNSASGTITTSVSLTLAMGDIASVSPVRGSPIAVIGDTRKGEYELTLGFCSDSAPTSSELSSLTNLSNWGFEFNRGYSGDQFPMPSDARVSYTNFLDSTKNLYYINVYFYFSTPDYFDSFLIRKAPSLRNIRIGAFAFNKYTGTISDQLTQSSQQWDYQNPSHSSFTSANQSASSTVSAFSSIEADAFSNLNTAMSGAGVNDFNINVISTPLATVSAMINQTYNILPDLVKWLILAILVIGIFAVIISANNYVNKD